jgi:hypothetical protein
MASARKIENLAHAVSLHYMRYNFARVHATLGTTPAIAAGITDHKWTLKEIASRLTNVRQASLIHVRPWASHSFETEPESARSSVDVGQHL